VEELTGKLAHLFAAMQLLHCDLDPHPSGDLGTLGGEASTADEHAQARSITVEVGLIPEVDRDTLGHVFDCQCREHAAVLHKGGIWTEREDTAGVPRRPAHQLVDQHHGP
jgi:hypothetical protein